MATKKAKRKKRNRWLIIGGILLIALLAVLAYFKGKQKPKGESVQTEKVEKRTLRETVSASGRVFPEVEVKISSDVSGEIVDLFVEEGDSVVMGQVLAKIDPDSYISAVERGEAGLNNAKAQLAISNSQIESNIAQKEQINAQLINARKIHERNTQLRNDGVISEADFEQSLSNLQQLEANLRAAEASLNSARESAKGAKFSVNSSQASLKELTTSLNRTTIKSPTNGVVSSLSVEKGERVVGTIQMAGTEMMRIANLNAMEVQVEVSENDILRVSLDDEVDIEVDAYLDKKFKGTVTQIANSAANASSITGSTGSLNTDRVTNFIVKIRIDPNSYIELLKDGRKYPFRPGMSASVDIYTEVAEDVLSVPIQAVTTREIEEEDDEAQSKSAGDEELREVVFIYEEGDTARLAEVETGIQDDEYIQLISGVEEEELVVSGPYSAISKKLESGSALKKKDDSDKDKDKD